MSFGSNSGHPNMDGVESWPVPASPARPRSRWEPGNRLLAALPRLDQALIAGELERITFEPGQTLKRSGEPVTLAIFPASGVISLVAEPGPGESADVGLVGREDVLGLPALFGHERAELRWLVRVGGEGHAIRLDALRARMHVSAALRDLLGRRLTARLSEMAAGAACLVLHPLPQRLATRLLALQDRTGPCLEVTQSTLAEMLNARRPTVSTELHRLRVAGLIRHVRGRIAIADRAGLAAIACPCHASGAQARQCSAEPGSPQ